MVAFKDPLFKDEELDSKYTFCCRLMHVKQATTCVFFYFLVSSLCSLFFALTIGTGTVKEALEFITIPLNIGAAASLIYALKLESPRLLLPSLIFLIFEASCDLFFVLIALISVTVRATFLNDWLDTVFGHPLQQDDQRRALCLSFGLLSLLCSFLNLYLAYLIYRCHNYFKESIEKRSEKPFNVTYHA